MDFPPVIISQLNTFFSFPHPHPICHQGALPTVFAGWAWHRVGRIPLGRVTPLPPPLPPSRWPTAIQLPFGRCPTGLRMPCSSNIVVAQLLAKIRAPPTLVVAQPKPILASAYRASSTTTVVVQRRSRRLGPGRKHATQLAMVRGSACIPGEFNHPLAYSTPQCSSPVIWYENPPLILNTRRYAHLETTSFTWITPRNFLFHRQLYILPNNRDEHAPFFSRNQQH